MHKKYNKPLLIITAICLTAAVLWDGFLGGQGLGTVVGCLTMITAIVVCTGLTVHAQSAAKAAAKRDADFRLSLMPKTPIFAHVPGPGEPGYDPNYDPDDDKYWRRYYRD